ncbi:MAG TPA: DUF1499 domain-containing protein, partial [Chroococcidiopsis sp.]
MLRFVLTPFLALVLTVFGTVGIIAPAYAQPQPAPYITFTATTTATITGGASMFSFPGKRPDNLGVKDGALATCPSSPNCVSSQAPAADAIHAIAPLSYGASPETAIATLKTVIEGLERTKIITATSDYLYAEFSSKLMGFVDDVEFYLS